MNLEVSRAARLLSCRQALTPIPPAAGEHRCRLAARPRRPAA